MKRLLIFNLLLMLLMITGCKNNTSTKVYVPKNEKLALELANYPDYVVKPDYDDFEEYDDYLKALDEYNNAKVEYDIHDNTSFNSFMSKTINEIIDSNSNSLYSPLNVYLALSILAETTGGDSKTELLNLLSVDSLDSLRSETKTICDSVYKNSEKYVTNFGESIWLRNENIYNEDTLKLLSKYYYCSSFNGVMGSDDYNKEFRNWMNSQTNNLLKDQIKDLKFESDTMFAIISTLYYKSSFESEFNEKLNTKMDFNNSDGSTVNREFMVKSYSGSRVYFGDMYSSISIAMEDGGSLKLILPKDGYNICDLMNDDRTIEYIINSKKYSSSNLYDVNVKMPKFDIESKTDLIESLKKLGVNKIFNPSESDFSSLTSVSNLMVDKIIHGVRVKVDEEGIEGAAYTFISNKCTSIGPTQSYDFILDRPFIYVVTSENDVPLFIGTVNNLNN